jgi:hypothetical protein
VGEGKILSLDLGSGIEILAIWLQEHEQSKSLEKSHSTEADSASTSHEIRQIL